VHDGTAELGFVQGETDDPVLDSLTVARDRLLVVVGPDHPWAAAEVALPPAALADSDWVLREAGSGTRSAFEAAVRGFGLDPRALPVALELPSNEAVRAAVEAGMGATAISATVVAGSLEAGLLRQVPITLPERSFRVLHHRDRTLSRAAAALLALAGASSG
jgi:DNA-binding transcriptional LysR family regulator